MTSSPSVVWTGTEAIAIGGLDDSGDPRISAAAFDPATETWRTLQDPPIDNPVVAAQFINQLVVWTGTEVLVLGGGSDGPRRAIALGGHSYDSAVDEWRSIPIPFPTGPVSAHTPSVWTGTELLVWTTSGPATDAGAATAFDPVTDTWRELSAPPAIQREHAASVWTGTEWIIWGGHRDGADLDDGVAYNPATDTWRTIADSPLSPRRSPAVWTGTEMLTVSGSSGSQGSPLALADGAAYDPATDTWRPIANGFAHPGFVPVWTGTQLVLFAKGGAVVYDPVADRWIDTCCNDTGGGPGGTPVWTGSTIVLLGSHDPNVGGSTFSPQESGSESTTTVSGDDRPSSGAVATAPDGSSQPGATIVGGASTAPGAAFFSDDCLADNYEQARTGGRVPIRVVGSVTAEADTGYSIGDSSAPSIGTGGKEWVPVGPPGTPPITVAGYVFTPNGDLLNAPSRALVPGCQPDRAIYDEEGNLIGRVIQAVPQTVNHLTIPPPAEASDSRSPVERLVGVPADSVEATQQWHVLSEQAISECMERAGFEYIPQAFNAETNPNADAVAAMPPNAAERYNDALSGGPLDGCEGDAATQLNVANALPEWEDLQSQIRSHEATVAAYDRFDECVTESAYTSENAPEQVLQHCQENADVPAVLRELQEQVEPEFIRAHTTFFAQFIGNIERLRNNAANSLAP